MKSEEALTAENAVEAKLAEIQTGIEEGGGALREAAPEPVAETTEVVEAKPPQPRDDQGRFAGEAPQETQDPAIAALLQKYGGDTQKALQAFVHAQRKLGEQSNEIGESRKIIDELVALRETVAQGQREPALDQATVDWFDQQVLENPVQALTWANQQNNQLLVQRGVSIWKDNDPYGAAMFASNLMRQQDRAEFEKRLSEVKQAPADNAVQAGLINVLRQNPEFEQYSDSLEATMERHQAAGDAFKAAVESGDQKRIEGTIETLYALAERDTLRALALGGAPAAETTTTQVVTQTETPEAIGDEQPEPSQTELWRQQFAEAAAAYKGDRVIPNAYVAR